MKLFFSPLKWQPLIATSVLSVGIAITALANVISVRTTLASQESPNPQAILMLGGNPNREEFTAEFAQVHDNLEVWVSSGVDRRTAREIFQQAGIERNRVHLDYRAVDTVTNFSTLVEDFQEQDIQHVYLITSDFHMPRAKAIATVILGSQGITFTPVEIPSDYPSESRLRIARDTARSVIWTFTGWAAENLNPHYALRRAIAAQDAEPIPAEGQTL